MNAKPADDGSCCGGGGGTKGEQIERADVESSENSVDGVVADVAVEPPNENLFSSDVVATELESRCGR